MDQNLDTNQKTNGEAHNVMDLLIDLDIKSEAPQ